MTVTITPAAGQQINRVVDKTIDDLVGQGRVKPEDKENARNGLYFRVSVQGGGCSGLQYNYSVGAKNDQDKVYDGSGARVVVDFKSRLFMEGSEIDWVENAFGAKFVVRNPNSKSQCGCGESFVV